MILYTIYDPNAIFEYRDFNDRQASKFHNEINIDGIMLEVSQSNKDYRVERIISTNPADYLNPRFQPGSLVKAIFK